MTEVSIHESAATTTGAVIHASVDPGEPKIPAHDPDMMLGFLRLLNPDASEFDVQFLPDAKEMSVPAGLHGLLRLPAERIVELMERYNTPTYRLGVFTPVNETGGGRKTEDIRKVRALVLDVDKDGKLVSAKLKGKLKPHAYVLTSAGKFHAWWFVSGVKLEEFKPLQRAIAKKYGGDPAICDLTRIMRLPGSLHMKDQPQLVKLLLNDNATPYTRDEVVAGLELDVVGDVTSRRTVDDLGPKPDWMKAKNYANATEAAVAAIAGAGGWFGQLGDQRDACLQDALTALIDVADGNREGWIKILMALQASGAPGAYEAGRKWSAASDKHTDAEFDKQWASFSDRPGGVKVGTLFAMAKERGWDSRPWKERANGVAAAAKAEMNTVFAASGSAMFSIPRPSPVDTLASIRHRPFLYGTRLLRGEISVLAAPGGRGKSATAIAIALALAAGRKLMHDVVFGAPKTVLLFSTEDGREELHRRILAAKQHYNLTDEEVARLRVAGADEGRFTLTTGSDKAAIVNQNAIDEFGKLIVELGADVLVLDPLGPLVPVGLNDNGLMAQLILALKQMASKHDCAVLLLHHFRKGADGSAESVSGASALVNHSRVAVTIESMKTDEGMQFGVLPSEVWRYFRLADAKSNFAPPSNGLDWLKLETVHLSNPEPPTFPNGDAVQVVAPMTFAAITRRGYLDPAERAMVVADIITCVGNAAAPPYMNARGGAKGGVTIFAMIASSVSRLANRPTSDAEVIATALFEELLHDELLVVQKVKTDQRKTRDGVILGSKAKSDA